MNIMGENEKKNTKERGKENPHLEKS